ncbi:hypothetical protein [Microbacterium wangruii]|uniref:hypothetical protein n=1 Tax=Microbacterium wangruii TaxID=3049073 RepID=UPI00256F4111|nr:hypothetical protein [Microbacterium sp. zg-Y1211]MDL5487931.1 hypothetical protein [Microbacterium sp. zg-Y1211]
MPLSDTARQRLLATIRTADHTGTLYAVHDDTLLAFAKGMAAETLLGGYSAAKAIAVHAYRVPESVCDTVTAAALPAFYPFTSALARTNC